MKISVVKTHKIQPEKDGDINAVLDKYLTSLQEGSVVAITSKILAICQGRYKKVGSVDKNKLIEQEAEYFLPPGENGFYLTIKYNLIIPSSGIDESNGNGYYILWPDKPQETANDIRAYLAKKHGVQNLGVIITDSKTNPLRWGITGVSITHSGFAAMNDYIGTPDIFGRELHFTKTNIMDGLGGAAVLEMGEGKEQTPLAVITDVPFVQFQQQHPTEEELKEVRIGMMQDDLYKEMLTSVPWQKGGS